MSPFPGDSPQIQIHVPGENLSPVFCKLHGTSLVFGNLKLINWICNLCLEIPQSFNQWRTELEGVAVTNHKFHHLVALQRVHWSGCGLIQIYTHPVTPVTFVRFRFYKSLENIKAMGYTFFSNSIQMSKKQMCCKWSSVERVWISEVRSKWTFCFLFFVSNFIYCC
jgi:hypothetical protein